MKPLGHRGLWKEENSRDKAPSKKIKKWKRGEKQRAKKEMNESLCGLPGCKGMKQDHGMFCANCIEVSVNET